MRRVYVPKRIHLVTFLLEQGPVATTLTFRSIPHKTRRAALGQARRLRRKGFDPRVSVRVRSQPFDRNVG